jgi:hypothetical protein
MAKRQGMGNKVIVITSGTPDNVEGFGLAIDIKVEGVHEELFKAGHDVRFRFMNDFCRFLYS